MNRCVLLLLLVACSVDPVVMPFGARADGSVEHAATDSGAGGAGGVGGAGGASECTNQLDGSRCGTGTCSAAGVGVNYQCFRGECVVEGGPFDCGTRGCHLTVTGTVTRVTCNTDAGAGGAGGSVSATGGAAGSALTNGTGGTAGRALGAGCTADTDCVSAVCAKAKGATAGMCCDKANDTCNTCVGGYSVPAQDGTTCGSDTCLTGPEAISHTQCKSGVCANVIELCYKPAPPLTPSSYYCTSGVSNAGACHSQDAVCTPISPFGNAGGAACICPLGVALFACPNNTTCLGGGACH